MPSKFFWPFAKKLKMTALAALKSITLDEEGFVSCARRAMSMPLEGVAPAKRADDWLAPGLKLMRTDYLFHCGFNPALNCCDGFVHNDFEVAEQYGWAKLLKRMTNHMPELDSMSGVWPGGGICQGNSCGNSSAK